jgi:deoxyribodipyrimidine photo-lyase
MTSIVWFRQDLRISDNPALSHAAALGAVIPVYIFDDTIPASGWPMASASRWWLHHSLAELDRSLGGLAILRGDPRRILPSLVREMRATRVFWNRCYEPYAIKRDAEVKSTLQDNGIEVASFNGGLLFEPWEVKTQGGGHYQVFTPFWRACQKLTAPQPLRAPPMASAPRRDLGGSLADLSLLPRTPNWAVGFSDVWSPGESGAQRRLTAFLDGDLDGYGELRNRPDLSKVSRLSPHLHFGEISPRQIWWATRMIADGNAHLLNDAQKFLSELGWREFSYHLLFHYPNLPETNWKAAFDAYPWSNNESYLRAWQRGKTGYPIVDAGMRELWATGYMHNRVRMIAASFLIKHLRIDWRQGEAWFWDTLVDADLANNAAGWQWVAGSGADAAPYFRVFNPIEQGRKFDPDGEYVRRWCPELKSLPSSVVHAPFEAPDGVLRMSGVTLGVDYPKPIVEHHSARAAALEGYAKVKATSPASSAKSFHR